MIRPDLRPICENMLMAEGFVKARALAVKFVTLYSLSSELLSKQVRYGRLGAGCLCRCQAVRGVLHAANGRKSCARLPVNDVSTLHSPVKAIYLFFPRHRL